jgi:hypothetical protein
MNCPKFTAEGRRCALPIGHPNFCTYDSTPPKPIMTKAGVEAQQLVDAMQRPKLVLQRNPSCEKCKGRAYNELPENEFGRTVEHSICSKCGGYLYTPSVERMSYATKSERSVSPVSPSVRTFKTASGKLETPDLTAARLAEEARKSINKRDTSRFGPRNYMAEAKAQADRDVQGMVNWNGF